MTSIFTKIINREIPAHIIYEDDQTLAFLDINPVQPGHTLVVPKLEVNHLHELPEEDYAAVMITTKMLMGYLQEQMGTDRVCLKVEGFDVPHAHVHLIPANSGTEFTAQPSAADQADLAKLAEQLKL
jgi:histidine triad (HIT) family protein